MGLASPAQPSAHHHHLFTSPDRTKARTLQIAHETTIPCHAFPTDRVSQVSRRSCICSRSRICPSSHYSKRSLQSSSTTLTQACSPRPTYLLNYL
eukprot:6200526-Pleurochrysis_carterae.AAC.2